MRKLMGWCRHHKEDINQETYERKVNRDKGGCFGCNHFFPYRFENELAKKLKVTPQTIRRWIRTEKLEGCLSRSEDGTWFECIHHLKTINSPILLLL